MTFQRSFIGVFLLFDSQGLLFFFFFPCPPSFLVHLSFLCALFLASPLCFSFYSYFCVIFHLPFPSHSPHFYFGISTHNPFFLSFFLYSFLFFFFFFTFFFFSFSFFDHYLSSFWFRFAAELDHSTCVHSLGSPPWVSLSSVLVTIFFVFPFTPL